MRSLIDATRPNVEPQMKILYIGLARSIWVFDFNLLNPKGLSIQPIIDKLTEKYKFAKAPKNPLDYDDQKVLGFKSGTFINSKGTTILITFSIYSDGFVAETMSSTDDSTDFLVEVSDWIRKDYGLALPSDIKKAYVSQIDFEWDTPFVQLNPGLKKFLNSIDACVKPIDGKPRHFDLAGLSFWTEDATKPTAPAIIKFERKLSASFASNHYFSQAPMETQSHIDLLKELGQLLQEGAKDD